MSFAFRAALPITLSALIAAPCLAAPPARVAPMEPKLAAVQKLVRGMYGPNIQTLLVGSKVDGRGRQGWTYYRSVLLGKNPRTIQLAAVKASSGGKLKIISTSGSFLGTHLSLPGIPAGSKLPNLAWDLK